MYNTITGIEEIAEITIDLFEIQHNNKTLKLTKKITLIYDHHTQKLLVKKQA